ncbi:hypothetical protein P12x_002860 [Tundrisphaera lichenicola]|uniref:hypothetical protein n=1 Tax=Tundrisphaera lichenicola TaxID=2029860 RepID=UPI003EBE5808
MRLPQLWLTSRGATLIRYSIIAIIATSFASKYLYEALWGRPMTLAEVADLGGVRLMVVTEGGTATEFLSTVHAEAPPEADWHAYLPLLKAELGLYTPRMLGEAGLRSVVLCGGLTDCEQSAAGLAGWRERTIYLLVPGHRGSKDFARRTIHHELFHLIDLRHNAEYSPDPGWAGLNQGSFRYGEGGRHERAPGATRPDESVPGFLNRYSRSGPEEDKAEIYAHLMAGRDLIEGRADRDEVLSSKCVEMKNRMSRYFPEVGPTFWEKGHESGHD